MTDPDAKVRGVEPRGPLNELERDYYKHIASYPNPLTLGDRAFVQPCRDLLALDDALRAALKDRDEARERAKRAEADLCRSVDLVKEATILLDPRTNGSLSELRAKLEIAVKGLKTVRGVVADLECREDEDCDHCVLTHEILDPTLAKLEEKS